MNLKNKNLSKKLIIFGGSFDPIHEGHIKIAKNAFNKIKASKLFFVPCGNHPNQKKTSASDKQRIDMIRLAIKNYPRFEVCDYEIANKGENISYTINTIRYIKENYSEYELYLLIGYDQLINFKYWKDYKEILEYAKIMCHVRKIDPEMLKEVDFSFIKVGVINLQISSTELRIRPKKKYLNPEVLEYINENSIYAIDRLAIAMSEYRLKHSIAVAEIAKDLAIRHKLYPLVKKAYCAGIYHDYAKELPEHELVEIAEKKLKIHNFASWKILHGPVGAYLVKKNFLIDDYQVLTAIKNHVIPKDFSTLTKIIYIADKICPRIDTKKDEQYLEWIKLSKKDIDLCFKTIYDFFLNFYDNKDKR